MKLAIPGLITLAIILAAAVAFLFTCFDWETYKLKCELPVWTL